MSRTNSVRYFLMDILRRHTSEAAENGVRVKLLIENAIIEGTLGLARNEKLAGTYSNGLSDHSVEAESVYLTDIAIRPLSDPEVHVGLNEMHLLFECINGLIAPIAKGES